MARERFRHGDREDAIPIMHAAIDQLAREEQLLVWGTAATSILVETLLDCADDGDVVEAEAAIDRLATTPADHQYVMRDIWLLRMQALLARAKRDEDTYRDYRDRYRKMANDLGFEGHMQWAEEMP